MKVFFAHVTLLLVLYNLAIPVCADPVFECIDDKTNKLNVTDFAGYKACG
jgi:hypothetical protein